MKEGGGRLCNTVFIKLALHLGKGLVSSMLCRTFDDELLSFERNREDDILKEKTLKNKILPKNLTEKKCKSSQNKPCRRRGLRCPLCCQVRRRLSSASFSRRRPSRGGQSCCPPPTRTFWLQSSLTKGKNN